MFKDVAPFALAGLVLVVSGFATPARAQGDIGFDRAAKRNRGLEQLFRQRDDAAVACLFRFLLSRLSFRHVA